jgi:hypothetical protein
MAKKPPDEPVNLRLRMPEALRKKLAAEAEANERSLNSEIVYRLGQSLGAEDLVRMHESSEERIRRMLEEIVAKHIAKAKPDVEGKP